MKITSATKRSLMEFIKEKIEDAGIPNGSYTVIDAHPNDINDNLIFPVITIGSPFRNSEPVELSAGPRKILRIAIDVLANSEGQQNDIVDVLQENLEEHKITIYNFKTGFPSSVGDYSGITQVGEMFISSFSSVSLGPSKFEKIAQEKYHELINITVKLPLINL